MQPRLEEGELFERLRRLYEGFLAAPEPPGALLLLVQRQALQLTVRLLGVEAQSKT